MNIPNSHQYPYHHFLDTPICCPNCQHSFTVGACIILDLDDFPDFPGVFFRDHFNNIECPKCAYEDTLSFPLLIFRKSIRPWLIFSSGKTKEKHSDEQLLIGFLNKFREVVGDDWDDSWMSDILVCDQDDLLPLLTNTIFDEKDDLAYVESELWDNLRFQKKREELDKPNPKKNISHNIEVCYELLTMVSKTQERQLKVKIELMLAGFLQQDQSKNRPANIEKAISLYTMGLDYFTRAQYPFEWAKINSDLAIAFLSRIHGNKKDNQEKAIELSEKSL